MKKQNSRAEAGLVTGVAFKFRKFPLVGVLALGVSAALSSCSADPPLPSPETEALGSLGVNLEAAPGVTLNAVSYSITGNGFTKSGSLDVSGAPSISGTIGGIPAGNGFSITLSASSTDGATTFTGSANFNVKAGAATSVAISLRGTSKSSKGSVLVNGSLNIAPVIDELSVAPLSVKVGSSIKLTGLGSDPDTGPSPLSYYWSTTGGVLADPLAASTTLTSSTPGTFSVKLTLSDGQYNTSTTTSVTFIAPSTGGGETDAGTGTGTAKRPNVLLIIADDLGAESTSVYPSLVGNSGAVPVPNIESLAANGLVFDNAWSSPACSMTRGTIVSGLYGYRTGVTSVGAVLPTSTVTVFDRITNESPVAYGQALFGKYHLGGGLFDPLAGGAFTDAPTILQHVRDLGIPTFRGILGGALTDYFSWNIYDTNGPAVPSTTYATTGLTDVAIDYIQNQEATRPGEPWFIYQSYNAPHAANGPNSPYEVPPPNLHSVDLSTVGNPAPGTSATNIPVYKANVQSLDTEIGRLIQAVDLNNTVVIFIGDNGTPDPVKDTGTHIRGSKGSVYEGGVRIPFIVAGAGVTRRGREDDLVVTTDLYATVLSLTGVDVSHVNNSYNVAPLFSDAAAKSGRTHSFSETSSGTTNRRWATRDTRFKLLSNLGVLELYDLATDPLETTDLYANPAYAAVRGALEAEITTLKADAQPGYFP